MARCDTCGNDYDKPFVITSGTASYTFDSFECAIQKLAPTCSHCKCRIIGHGVEDHGTWFCCANCARKAGSRALVDRT